MESPLSFNSTENFRKKLLAKNLPPYNVDSSFTANGNPAVSEFNIVDYSIIDSDTIENIGNVQENIIYPINQYGPNAGINPYGDVVLINLNLNYSPNEGSYGAANTVGSTLEEVGNISEISNSIKNVYKPQNVGGDYGNSVYYINNDNVISTVGSGLYDVFDTENGFLFQNGVTVRGSLFPINQYGPVNGQSVNVVVPNNNFQTNTNEGNYDLSDTIGSTLEVFGFSTLNTLAPINQYGPVQTNIPIPNVNYQTNSNEGEYSSLDAIGSDLEIEGIVILNTLAPINQYGPVQTNTPIPNINYQTNSNEGEYSSLDAIGSTLEVDGISTLNSLVPINQYGPVQPNTPIPNVNYQTNTNEGEYSYLDAIGSDLEIEGNLGESIAYLKNKYVTGTGGYSDINIKDLIIPTTGLAYAKSDSTFVFLPSIYSPLSILLSDNPSGSDGSLSQDSALAGLAAKQLQKEFKHRVALELIQQTLGLVNVINTNVNDNNGLTISPNLNPFDILGILSGNIPIIGAHYNITVPDGLFGQAINFAAKLAGTYSPYSYIPDDYFDYPGNQSAIAPTNILSLIGGAIANVFSVIQPANQTSSELFIEYTSQPTKNLLFRQLKFNAFRPQYKDDGLINSAPPGKFYIGEDKNSIPSSISGELSQGKGGEGTVNYGAVLSYGNVGKLYEGEKITEILFGFGSVPYYDSLGGVQGGITWMSNKGNAKENYILPGQFVGFNLNSQMADDSDFNFTDIGPSFEKTKSTNFEFTPGSILDMTQKLVDAGNRSTNKLEHVGNAINQISKVFNDGYQELTKGSRVIRYTTPTSQPNSSPTAVGYEYCRLFTKDRPYMSYDELQKTDGNIRKYGYSVLDNTFNLNIAPMNDNAGASTNIVDGKVKKYMFSLENLAWRTSNVPGFTYEDLPACEKGPNGGRIMWFPPYDLSFDENTNTSWQDNTFLGRPEPIYTYTNSKRSGNVSFKVIVDHPSILNVIVDKVLENESSNSTITKVIDSFFAGCTKYDLYDLVLKFPNFTPRDIFYTQQILKTPEDVEIVVKDTPDENIESFVEEELIVIEIPGPTPTPTPTPTPGIPGPTPTPTEPQIEEVFKEIGFYFANDFPRKFKTTETYVENGVTKCCKRDQDKADTAYDVENTRLLAYKTFYLNGGEDDNDKPIEASRNKIFKYNDSTYADQGPALTSTLTSDEVKRTYLKDYIDQRNTTIEEFMGFVTTEFAEAQTFVKTIGNLLDAGSDVSFTIMSSASSVTNVEYNIHLSIRRIDSVIKWLEIQKTPQGKTIKSYIDSNKLNITKKPKGEEGKLIEPRYSNIDCTKSFLLGKNEGMSSVNAMSCRRARILDIKATNIKTVETKPIETVVTEVLPQQAEGTTTDPFTVITPPISNSSQKIIPTPAIKETIVTPITKPPEYLTETKVFKDLTKKLARKLLTECNYFELVKQTNPIIYDGMASKLKNFHPAFHSITPEGLNSRLTFLNQCMRPGSTIPTVTDSGTGDQSLLYNDVTNSVFGAPPVCVLRIGDFYHTKIVIDTLNIKYDDGKFDLNPEGIGVQPMIANVTLGFNFIGGHGLKEPIAKLQNALSFNYYANTEMYDERSDMTEDVTSQFDAELLQSEKDRLGIIDEVPPRPITNEGGVTIGEIISGDYDLNTNISKGSISYEKVMKTLVEKTSEYMESTYENLKKLNEELLYGGIIFLTKDRKYVNGYFNYLSGDTTNSANIFGSSEKLQEKVQNLIKMAKVDVDDDLCPLLAGVYDENFKKTEITKVKREIKKLIDSKLSVITIALENAKSTINTNQLSFINYVDKINYVANANDGYINKKGEPLIFSLSGTSGIDVASVGVTNTFDEMVQDYLQIKTKINNYYDNLFTYKIIPSGATNEYVDTFLFDTYQSSPILTPEQNRFFILFGKDIALDAEGFSNEIIDVGLKNEDDQTKNDWKTFFGKIFYPKNTGLVDSYNKSKTDVEKRFKQFYDEYYNEEIKLLKTLFIDKKRLLYYESQIPIGISNDINLQALWSSESTTWDKFNGKKSFN